MMDNAAMNLQRAKEVFDYNPATGIIINRINRGKVRAGDEAGTLHCKGYRNLKIDGERFLSHRLAWFIYYGYWPKSQIDHINGNKLDNRISNLRDVTNKENHKNREIGKNNTSGTLGVWWNKLLNKWQAQITVDRKQIYLGVFNDKNEAILERTFAERKYGFHENHGRGV